MTQTNTTTQTADNINQLLATLHSTVNELIEEVNRLEQLAKMDAIRDFELDELDFYYGENKTPILSVYDL